jgi:hypothetical protein
MQDVSLKVLVRDFLAAANEVDRTVYRNETAARIDETIRFSRLLRQEILSREGGVEALDAMLVHEVPTARYWAAIALRKARPARAEAALEGLIRTGTGGMDNAARMTLMAWRRRAKIAPFKERFFPEWGRIRNLSGLSIADLQRGFVEAVLMQEYSEPSAEGTAIANRAWKVMGKIQRELMTREQGLQAFEPLLTHEEAHVCLWAAAFLIDHCPDRAQDAVHSVANRDDKHARRAAKNLLENWRISR